MTTEPTRTGNAAQNTRRGRPANLIPTLRMERGNSAYVEVHGRRIRLGKASDPATIEKYKAIVAGLLAGEGPPEIAGVQVRASTMSRLGDLYLEHCARAYRKRGRPTSYSARVRRAFELLELFGAGSRPIVEFGPRRLSAFLTWMSEAPRVVQPVDAEGKAAGPSRTVLDAQSGLPVSLWSRQTCNDYARAIVKAMQWGVAQELIPETQYRAACTVPLLRAGRESTAVALREPSRRSIVRPDAFESTLKRCTPTVAAMARVQSLAAMRPGEVVAMRSSDLRRCDQDGVTVLVYEVPRHVSKTAHFSTRREVYIGPRAAEIILSRLSPGGGVVFRPSDSVREAGRPQRTTEAYTVHAYRRAITRACRLAGVERWTPARLRHTGATKLAQDEDIEAARRALGHAKASTTRIYVDPREYIDPDVRKSLATAAKHG